MKLLATSAALMCVTLLPLAAQDYRGTVTGIITDRSNAVIANVKVQITNVEQNNTATAYTNSSGVYTFSMLEPGTYRLRAEVNGFKPVDVERLVVYTSGRIGLNLMMEVGDLTQRVQVTAESALLNTQSADTGQVIDNSRINELPMLGRSPFILARLSPGVLLAGQINDTKPYDVAGQSFVSIGGGRRYNTEFQINGVPDVLPVGYFSGRVAYTPPADGTQEFQVVTNSFDAQYGSSGNGIISVTTKAGTNRPHGSLYEFLQNDKLNATNFFVNATGGKKPPRRYNQFGGSFGGPVVIPKVVNGKDKLFFFFAYEGIRNASPGSGFATVPTQQMRGGDFSQLLARGVQLYNPFSVTRDANGNTVRAPFPGNIIPANLLSPVAKNILNEIPLPNISGATLENNYFSSTGTYDIYNNYLGRMDYYISDRHRVFFNIGEYSTNNRIADLFHTLATGGTTQGPKQIISFNDTFTWSPTWVSDLRLGYSGYSGDTVPKSVGADMNQLGFPASFTSQTLESAFPRVDMTYFSGFGVGTNANNTAVSHTSEHAHTYFAAASFTKLKGSHTLRFGVEGREKQDYSWSRGNASGAYTFNGQYTAGPGINAGAGFGTDLASFMLGLPSGGGVDQNTPAGLRGRYYAFFAQDDWKVSRTLTLNLGVRYDVESPTYEQHNRIVAGWLWNQSNPIEAAAQANYAKAPDPALAVSQFKVPGGDIFAGTNGLPSGVWDWNYGNIMPRLGLAWNPDVLKRKVTFRTGWGITYYSLSPSGTGTWQYGYSQATSFVPTADNGVTFLSTLSNPYPNGLTKPVGNSLGPLTNLGLGNDAITRKQLQPRNNHWVAAIQYQPSRSDVIEVNYNGSVVVHTPGTNYPINFIPAQYMGTSLTRDNTAIAFLSAPVTNPFFGIIPANTPLGQRTITRAQLLMPYPEFGTTLRRGDNSGSITNEQVFFAWNHRMGKGLTVLANYMIAKQMWARDRKNPQDTQFERRIGPEDRPQQLTISASYDLPIGTGKAVASKAGRGVNQFIGGWQVSGIYTAAKGQALSWGAVVFTGNSWRDIVNVPGGQTIDHWINTAVFNRNANDQPNTAYQFRYFPTTVPAARTPGINTLDLSLNKNVRITEAANLQIRADAFDALNHPNWGAPNVTPTSTAFGRITSQANLPRTLQLGMRLSF